MCCKRWALDGLSKDKCGVLSREAFFTLVVGTTDRSGMARVPWIVSERAPRHLCLETNEQKRDATGSIRNGNQNRPG